VEIIRRMHAQYGDNCLSFSKIYGCVDQFKQWRTSVFYEIRKAVNVKDWELYSSRWKGGTGKPTNHSGWHCWGFNVCGPM